MTRKTRVAIVATHPIPYYLPLYRALAQQPSLEIRVYFASRVGLERTLDPGMGVEIVWKTDLLAGYQHEFLPGAENVLSTRPREIDNPGTGASLGRFRPDVALLHGYLWKTAFRALLWCKLNGVPAMMISDGSLHSGTGRVVRALKAAILPLVFRQFRAFHCVGDSNARYFETYGVPRARLFSVPMLANESFWAYREGRERTRVALRTELGLSAKDLAVLFVGKLIPRKRPGDLLEALKRLAALPLTRKRVVVLFAGDGMLRTELEAMAARHRLPALFVGFVNIDKLPAYYCAADALAHPAEIETFGVIVLEAAILGLPLVLSDRVGAIGPTSIARPGQNALVHACGDIEELARHLEHLANDPELLTRLADASRSISSNHDGRASVSGALAAIEFCLGRSAGRVTPSSPSW